MNLDDDAFLDRQGAANWLRISLRTLDFYLATKRLPVRRIGRRVLIQRRDIEKFAARDQPILNRKTGVPK
jgi:excisionase family DNA binding protein